MYQGRARHPVMIALAETVERVRHPDRAVRGADLGLRAGPDRHRIPHLRAIARLLHAVGQPGGPPGPVCRRRIHARRTRGWPTPPARRCNWPTSGRTWPATWRSAGSTCPARIGLQFGYSEADLRALRFTPAFAGLMKFEVERPALCLREGRRLVPRMPRALAVDIDLFSRGGLAILDRDRGAGIRRPERPAGPEPLDQAPAAGASDRWPWGWPRSGDGSRPGCPGVIAGPCLTNGDARRMTRDDGGAVRRGETAVRTDQVLQASYRFCGALARRQARNFYYAFLLLPRARRRSMCALYAFLRHTDDLADEPGSAAEKARALDAGGASSTRRWRAEARRWPGLPALADTVARHGIPAHLLHEVIDGVSMDLQPRRFATFDDLADYCHHVASVVGLCCLHIWGYRSEGGKAEQLAERCGIALQLTNIIRDVRDDARNGRIYLPRGRPGAVRRGAGGTGGRRPAQRPGPRAAGLRGPSAPIDSTSRRARSRRWSPRWAGPCS